MAPASAKPTSGHTFFLDRVLPVAVDSRLQTQGGTMLGNYRDQGRGVRRVGRGLSVVVAAALTLVTPYRSRAVSFVEFDSGSVRPLAMTPDGTRLLAVNTPDNRLELFTIDAVGLTHTGSVPVGME